MMLRKGHLLGKGKGTGSRRTSKFKSKYLKTSTSKSKSKSSLPSLEDFLEKRDYNGASTLLNFQSRDRSNTDLLLWKAYCFFHNSNTNDYSKAQEIYIDLLLKRDSDSGLNSGSDGADNTNSNSEDMDIPEETMLYLYLALTYYHMQMYEEAQDAVGKGPDCPLKNRIMFHLAHHLDDGELVEEYRIKLDHEDEDEGEDEDGCLEDQLSKASMLYNEGLYQDALDTFKPLLADNRDYVALHLYVAMCYFKLGYFDVSQETLAVYEQMHSDSVLAKNLKACNNFRLYDGNAALDELKTLQVASSSGVGAGSGSSLGLGSGNHDHNHAHLIDNDLLRHNMVVFADGQMALQTLPHLMDSIPEARLNLAIYHLREGEYEEADAVMDDCDEDRDRVNGQSPIRCCSPQEFIVKGVVKASLGQEQGDLKAIREAQSYFETIGNSPTETDTIPGRQAMASALYLQREFEDANVYLGSIQTYMADDDDFNWNYGMSLAAAGDYSTAEKMLCKINEQCYKDDMNYCTWLARCKIMNGNAPEAWKMYSSNLIDRDCRIPFLKVFADDCFRSKQFLEAMKAFDALQKLELEEGDSADYSLGLKSAFIGVFRSVVLEKVAEKRVSMKGKAVLIEASDIIQQGGHTAAEDLKRTLITIKLWMKKNIA